jgi:amidohydrolase
MISASITEAEQARLVATRRDLHAHPELGFEETRTQAIVLERLTGLGLTPRRVAGTGVIADVQGARPGKTVLLRADLDGLPLTEENQVEYRSTSAGRMHACGHDGHVASLLGVAERLVARPDFAGRVRLCFQPAEEGAGGAARMLAEGILEGVDAAFGVHVWNDLAVGKVALATGPVMAAVDKLDIELEGVGGHGAMPQQTKDPVVAAAHLVVALQTIVSRETSPLDSAVVTIGSLQAGTNWNVIPRTARLAGTARTYARPTYEAIQGRIERVTRGVADALCCKATIGYERICPPLVNHPQATTLARQVAGELLGADAVVTEGTGTRTMGGEDFAFFLERVPGCFVFVGSRNEARGLCHPHHSPRFDFDEAALGHSVRVLEGIARRYLASGLPTT